MRATLTGPENYREAAAIADRLDRRALSPSDLIAVAQVRATLALTAAVIETAADRSGGATAYPGDWFDIITARQEANPR